jgi:hypothetical protein
VSSRNNSSMPQPPSTITPSAGSTPAHNAYTPADSARGQRRSIDPVLLV